MDREEELLTGRGEEVGDGRAEGSSAIEDRGQAAISLTPDGSGSLLDSILSTLLLQWCLCGSSFFSHHG